MDRQAGWWQHRVAAGEITIGQFFTALDHLGLDPIRFVRQALGREHGLELDRPHGTAPEIVERAWDRFCSGVDGQGIGAICLETLDQERYQGPEEVMRVCLWAIDRVEIALL